MVQKVLLKLNKVRYKELKHSDNKAYRSLEFDIIGIEE